MKDMIPLGTGNSRSLKAGITTATTWEEFRDLLINGSLPIDIGAVNPAGVSQIGTLLCEQTLLPDTLAQSMKLNPDTAGVADSTAMLFNGLNNLEPYLTNEPTHATSAKIAGSISQKTSTGKASCALAAGNGVHVAIAADGTASVSTDGMLTWSHNTALAAAGATWNSIVFDGSRFVALSNIGRYAFSVNGVNWDISADMSLNTAQAGGWEGLYICGDYIFTTVEYSLYARLSKSSTVFTVSTFTLAGGFRCVAYNGTKYFAAGANGICMESTDGETWKRNDSLAGSSKVVCAVGNPVTGMFYVLVSTGTTCELRKSSNAITWTTITFEGVGIPQIYYSGNASLQNGRVAFWGQKGDRKARPYIYFYEGTTEAYSDTAATTTWVLPDKDGANYVVNAGAVTEVKDTNYEANKGTYKASCKQVISGASAASTVYLGFRPSFVVAKVASGSVYMAVDGQDDTVIKITDVGFEATQAVTFIAGR